MAGGHSDGHEWLDLFDAVVPPLGDGSMRTHGLRLVLLIDDDGSLQQQGFPGLLPVHGDRCNFDLNCRATVLAGLIVLALPRWLLPAGGHPEIAVVGLQGMHDLRCLFAERHPSNLLSFEHRIIDALIMARECGSLPIEGKISHGRRLETCSRLGFGAKSSGWF